MTATENTEVESTMEGIVSFPNDPSLLLTVEESVESESEQKIVEYDEITIKATESQYKAITSESAADTLLSIRAGPGSGKTHTLVNRIAYLITNCGIQPNEIIVLSMANRSVKSLQASLSKTIGDDLANKIQLSTFHSFCGTMLEYYGDLVRPADGRSGKSRRLMDDASWRAFSTIFSRKSIKLNGVSIDADITAVNLQRMISSIKSGKLSIEQAHKKYNVSVEYVTALLDYLNSNGLMMYSDLITEFLSMVKVSLKNESQEGHISDEPIENQKIPPLLRYKAVIVDEFQDMYHELLQVVLSIVTYPTSHDDGNGGKTISYNSKHLTIAGDPNQSIYEFLGSSPNLMFNIKEYFPSYKEYSEVILTEIFRSTPEIMKAATETSLSHLQGDRESTVLLPNVVVRPSGHKPIIIPHLSSEEEHFFIAREITRLICESGGLLTPSDFVVLARTNSELDQIEKLLTGSYDFRCNKLSSTVMWTYSRVLLFINILLVIQNSKTGTGGGISSFPLLCILQIIDPKGSKRISNLFNHIVSSSLADQTSTEDYLLDESSAELTKIYKNAPEKLHSLRVFLKVIRAERKKLTPPNQVELDQYGIGYTPYVTPKSLLKIVLDVCQKCDFLPYLNQQDNLNLYLESFNRSLLYCYQNFKEQKKKVSNLTDSSFLDFFVKNYGDQVPIIDLNMINLSTIHAAKGLEFPVVFVTGATKLNFHSTTYWETLLSGEDSSDSDSDKNSAKLEKARLFYVATTRAKHLLYVGTLKRESFKDKNSYLETLSKNLRDHFSPAVFPKFDDIQAGASSTLLERLSDDLNRTIPSQDKLVQGEDIFKRFETEYRPPSSAPTFRKFKSYNYHQRRNFCTSRLICNGLGKLAKLSIRR